MNYLSVCAIVKDETPYLREWVNYHTVVGVEQFFLYDNGSRVSVRATLQPEVASGRVVVVDVPWPRPQMVAYTHCLRYWGAQTRWIAFIDLDEFIVPKTTPDLRAFLEPFEPYGGLGVYWKIFGASGHLERPAGLQLQNFLQATGDDYAPNCLFKSIVQPQYACYPWIAHQFVYRPGYNLVNENQCPILSATEPLRAAATIQLNHYYTRSAAEFRDKIARGNAVVTIAARTLDEFYQHDRAAGVVDRAILEVLAQRLPQLGEQTLAQAAAACPLPGGPLPPAPPLDEQTFATFEMNWLAALLQAAEAQRDWAFVEHLLRVVLWRFSQAQWLWQSPWFSGPYLRLCDVFAAARQYAAAVELLEAAAEGWPEGMAIWTRLGLNLYGLGQLDRAEAAYRRALALAPSSLDAGLSLARVYSDQRRYPEAWGCLRQVVKAWPEEVEGWVGLAWVARALQDWSALEEAYARIQALDAAHPGLPGLRQSLVSRPRPAG